jgi:cytochrome c peroxidase
MAMVAALAACGDGSGSQGGGATTVPAPTPTATQTPSPFPATLAATTINPAAPDRYALAPLPAYYDGAVAQTDNTPPDNVASDRLAMLGRVLFYDRQLSINRATSCSSCHQQADGFGDPARFSTGFNGVSFTTAHAMRLGNVRYWRPGNMFWDRRAATLELQASHPITNPIEMGFDNGNGGMAALVVRLQAIPYYQELFTVAFGDATVSEDRIGRALANFERAIVSSASRWDTAFAQVFNPALPARGLDLPLPGFSPQEERGRQLFMTGRANGGAGCATCHVPPTFALDGNSQSNGLDAGETRIFKAPSLKNVGLSHFFMHDGRFSSLEQVIEFYDSGVQTGPALDNRLGGASGPPRRLNLSTDDKAALVAFLQTLADPALASDPRFSNPFR